MNKHEQWASMQKQVGWLLPNGNKVDNHPLSLPLREVPDIRSGTRYPVGSGILYPVENNILYLVESYTRYYQVHNHRFSWYLIFPKRFCDLVKGHLRVVHLHLHPYILVRSNEPCIWQGEVVFLNRGDVSDFKMFSKSEQLRGKVALIRAGQDPLSTKVNFSFWLDHVAGMAHFKSCFNIFFLCLLSDFSCRKILYYSTTPTVI